MHRRAPETSRSAAGRQQARCRGGALQARGLLLAGVCLVLAACGGSGGADGGAAGSALVSGVAATGAPMEGAVVRVFDARGQAVAHSAPVGSDGRYEVRIAVGARAPMLFQADLADGEDHFAVADEAAIVGGTVNITPITSLIAARLAPTGLPQDLVLQFVGQVAGGAAPPLPTSAQIGTQTQAVLGVIAPLRQVLGDTSFDPLTGRFTVGGVGHDKVLDSLAVTFSPRAADSANIEVALRTRRAADAPLPAVVFASNASGLPPLGSGLVRAAFAPNGTSARIAALVAEINACLALPVAARVTDPNNLTAAGVRGICATMYYDGNPTQFLHNGTTIGSGAGAELLEQNLQRLDQPVYRYTRIGPPDLVAFTVRWSDLTTGASSLVVIYARGATGAAGPLKLYGNQYAYGMQVSPLVLRQTHLRADSGHMDNLRSGYLLLVPKLQRAGGGDYFDRVEVETPAGLGGSPAGQVLILRPTPADPQHLQMPGQFDPASTSATVWVGGGWVDATAAADTMTTSGQRASHPIDLAAGGEVWISDPLNRGWTDERIEALSHQSVWTFRYFRHGNTSTTPDAEQHLLTISRAPSVRELRQIPFAAFDTRTVTWLRSGLIPPPPSPSPHLFWMGAAGGGTPPPPPVVLDWTVPSGALAPARVNGFGRATNAPATPWPLRTPFGQSVPVAAAQRRATMACATPTQALRDVLCDASQPDRYSANTMFTDFELWGRSLRLVEHSHSYATYIPHTRATATPPSRPLNAVGP